MEVLHPPIVHFAIGLTIVGIILELLWFAFKKEMFNTGALLNLGFSVIFVWIAFFAGHADEEKFEEVIKNTQAYTILEYHETLGLIVAVVVSILGGLKVLNYVRPIKFLRFLLVVLSLITFVLAVAQGNLGGKLVYEYGVGVKPVMEGQK